MKALTDSESEGRMQVSVDERRGLETSGAEGRSEGNYPEIIFSSVEEGIFLIF